MQTVTLPEPLQQLVTDMTLPYLLKILLLGTITFLVFYMILKTTDKHNTKEKIVKAICDKWERLLYGDSTAIVKDGVVQLDKLYKAEVTTQQVFNVMRSHNINNIALVKRMFVNPDYEFRVIAAPATPAIPILKNDLSQTEEMKSLKEIN